MNNEVLTGRHSTTINADPSPLQKIHSSCPFPNGFSSWLPGVDEREPHQWRDLEVVHRIEIRMQKLIVALLPASLYWIHFFVRSSPSLPQRSHPRGLLEV